MTYVGFRGNVNGCVQSVITDQPGAAVPGMLAFASDNDLVDSFNVGAGGVFAGAGVCLPYPTNSVFRTQQPNQLATLPITGKALADFGGVVVFDENMQSDATGIPGWDAGRNCRVLKRNRAGGRIWVS